MNDKPQEALVERRLDTEIKQFGWSIRRYIYEDGTVENTICNYTHTGYFVKCTDDELLQLEEAIRSFTKYRNA